MEGWVGLNTPGVNYSTAVLVGIEPATSESLVPLVRETLPLHHRDTRSWVLNARLRSAADSLWVWDGQTRKI